MEKYATILLFRESYKTDTDNYIAFIREGEDYNTHVTVVTDQK